MELEKMYTVAAVILAFLLGFAGYADCHSLSARQIMEKVEEQKSGRTRTHEMHMVLVDKTGSRQTKTIAFFSKSYAEETRRIVFITSPVKYRNMGLLTIDYKDGNRQSDQWAHIPSLGKHKRIAASDKSDSFMGSDLNYSDLAARKIDDYHYRIIQESEVKGQPVWLIESVPVSVSVVQTTGYVKSVLAVQKDTFDITRLKAWTREKNRVKLFDFDDHVEINGIRTARRIKVISLIQDIPQHQTYMQIKHIRFDVSLPDDLFSIRSLTKGFPGAM